MSIRTVALRIVQNGKIILRSLRYNEHYSTYTRGQLDKIHVVQVGKPLGPLPQGGSSTTVAATSTHLGYIGAQARRLFVDNILKRVTNSLAADSRRRAARRLLYGDSAPFFALVGVSLASGTGILTKEDELEGVCWEIREAVSKLQWTKPQNDRNYESISTTEDSPSLKNLVIGAPIAKGCSAVVYAAKFKDEDKPDASPGSPTIDSLSTDPLSFPYALKMMFNYDAESNALSILRAMYRETVPARKYHNNEEIAVWEQRMCDNKRTLPPHPNIVAMYYVFADRVPWLPGSSRMYPDALPARLNPEGSGRNMSLFLLMKRYDVTLKQYLKSRQEREEKDARESILLLAQLLEGVAHMNAHGIAHRDLKTDNILLDTSEVANCPSLVITDFGCCLADKHHGLYLPYTSHDVDRGGNSALMAPEVINAEPGPFTSINYTKSDLWTVGSIAYEVFGERNPFYGGQGEKPMLSNSNYEEDQLPELAGHVPHVIQQLVKNILYKSVHKRLTVEMAATIIQLYLWAPSSWLHRYTQLPSSNEIIQWLVCLTTKVLCEGREINLPSPEECPKTEAKKANFKNYQRMLSTSTCGRRTMPEYQLIASFLARVNLLSVRDGLRWIHKNASSPVV